MTAEANKTLVRSLIEERWNNPKGLEYWSSVVTPGYRHHTAVGETDVAGFQRGLGMYVDAFPGSRYEVFGIVADDETVAAFFTVTGPTPAHSARYRRQEKR
jgi:hypothetical protein